MLDNYAVREFAEVPFKSRIVSHFSRNLRITIIVQYSPIEEDDLAEEHYNNLTNVIKITQSTIYCL